MLLSNSYFQCLIRVIVVSFPIFVLTLNHASGVLFILPALIGLIFYSSLKKIGPFQQSEKLLIFSILFFLFVSGFAIILGNDPATGYRWFGKFLRLAFIIPLFLLLRKITISESQFWISLSAGAIFSGIVAIIELYVGHILGWGGGHTGRASGVTHPIMFGDISLTMGVMALCGLSYFRKQANWQIMIPILAIVMGVTASFLSGSRGAWIALPALFLLMLWTMRTVIPKKALTIVLIVMVTTPILVYNLPGVNVANRTNSTFNQYDEYLTNSVEKNLMGNPVGIRLEMWQASWTIFKDSPLLGIGWGNYQNAAQQLVDSGKRNAAIAQYRHPHNQYLSSMVSSGLIGLAATVILLVFPLIIFYKAYRHESESIKAFGIAGIILVVAFAHFALTEGVFERNITLNFYGFYLALITALIAVNSNSVSKSA